jgi:hypothetical protein
MAMKGAAQQQGAQEDRQQMLAQRRRGHAERLQQISGDHRDQDCALDSRCRTSSTGRPPGDDAWTSIS